MEPNVDSQKTKPAEPLLWEGTATDAQPQDRKRIHGSRRRTNGKLLAFERLNAETVHLKAHEGRITKIFHLDSCRFTLEKCRSEEPLASFPWLIEHA